MPNTMKDDELDISHCCYRCGKKGSRRQDRHPFPRDETPTDLTVWNLAEDRGRFVHLGELVFCLNCETEFEKILVQAALGENTTEELLKIDDEFAALKYDEDWELLDSPQWDILVAKIRDAVRRRIQILRDKTVGTD